MLHAIPSASFIRWPNPTTPHSLSGEYVREVDNNIMVVFQDRKNNLWMGSWKNGLYVFNGDMAQLTASVHR